MRDKILKLAIPITVQQFMLALVSACDAVTMWCFAVPLGFLTAFVFKLPVLLVYFVLNLDELVKLPAVFMHYRKYKWLKNLTETED